jgi:hypothetical protein
MKGSVLKRKSSVNQGCNEEMIFAPSNTLKVANDKSFFANKFRIL